MAEMPAVIAELELVTQGDDPVCDDCGCSYEAPPFYSFDPDDCTDGGADPHDCTGNICFECAGPYLIPDDPEDPRREMLTTDEILDMLAKGKPE
jgi:hypothetical protein